MKTEKELNENELGRVSGGYSVEKASFSRGDKFMDAKSRSIYVLKDYYEIPMGNSVETVAEIVAGHIAKMGTTASVLTKLLYCGNDIEGLEYFLSQVK